MSTVQQSDTRHAHVQANCRISTHKIETSRSNLLFQHVYVQHNFTALYRDITYVDLASGVFDKYVSEW